MIPNSSWLKRGLDAFSPHIQNGATALGGTTPVIKYGGSLLTDTAYQEAIARQLVILQHLSVQPIVVHGGGKHITAELNKAGMITQFVRGLRVTDDRAMKIIVRTLCALNDRLVATINRLGGQAVACGMEELPIEAETLDAKQLGRVGKITRITDLRHLTRAGIPFIPSLGRKGSQVYNINADTVAAAIAVASDASALLYLTDADGILDAQGAAQPELTIDQLRQQQQDGSIQSGMFPKSEAMIDALHHGIANARIINGKAKNCVLRALCTDKEMGTRVTAPDRRAN